MAGFGGFHHGFAFNHRFGFGRRFAFGGPVFFPGYYYGDAGYDACLRRVWGPYGWRLINVCEVSDGAPADAARPASRPDADRAQSADQRPRERCRRILLRLRVFA